MRNLVGRHVINCEPAESAQLDITEHLHHPLVQA